MNNDSSDNHDDWREIKNKCTELQRECLVYGEKAYKAAFMIANIRAVNEASSKKKKLDKHEVYLNELIGYIDEEFDYPEDELIHGRRELADLENKCRDLRFDSFNPENEAPKQTVNEYINLFEYWKGFIDKFEKRLPPANITMTVILRSKKFETKLIFDMDSPLM